MNRIRCRRRGIYAYFMALMELVINITMLNITYSQINQTHSEYLFSLNNPLDPFHISLNTISLPLNEERFLIEEPTRVITLHEAIELTLVQNLDLTLARAEEKVSDLRKEVEISKFIPSLEVGAFTGHKQGRLQGSFGDLQNVDYNTFDNQFGVVYRINIGKQVQSTLAASRELERSVLQTLDTKQRLLMRIFELYQNLIIVKYGVVVSKQLVDDSESFVSIARSREATGIGLGSEVARAEAKLASDRRELVELKKIWKSVSIGFAIVLNIPTHVLLDPAEDQLKLQFLISDSDVQNTETYASKRPDVLAAKKSFDSAEHKVSEAYWDLLGPEIAVGVQEHFIGDHADILNNRTDVGAYLYWSISVEKFNRIRQIKAEKEISKIRALKIEEVATGEINTARNDIYASQEQIPLAKVEVKAAETNLRISQSRYRAGTAIALEILDAENSLAQARLNLAKSIVAFNLAQARLVTATGIISKEIMDR